MTNKYIELENSWYDGEGNNGEGNNEEGITYLINVCNYILSELDKNSDIKPPTVHPVINTGEQSSFIDINWDSIGLHTVLEINNDIIHLSIHKIPRNVKIIEDIVITDMEFKVENGIVENGIEDKIIKVIINEYFGKINQFVV